MKKKLVATLIILGVSLFVGIIIISIGIGSVLPWLYQVSGPLVCSSGDLDVVKHVDQYRPGETYYSISAYCVDGTTGVKKDVTTSVHIVTGAIYSIILFVLLMGFVIKNWKTRAENTISVPQAFGRQAQPYKDPDSVDGKLEKLKELRESNLINDEDYQKKKDELLDNL